MKSMLSAGLAMFALPLAALAAPQPEFCNKPQGKADQLICADMELLAAERQLAGVYQAARAKAGERSRKTMAVEQRGWRAGVRDCWKADDLRACVTQQYQLRTLELQTDWQLVPTRGPFTFQCADGTELRVRYFETRPASLVARRKGEVALMRIAPSASGARYTGANGSLWEHQGELRLVWGHGAPETVCTRR